MAIKIISSSQSDKGKVRSSNQDSGYSGTNLYVVADGMGGHAGGGGDGSGGGRCSIADSTQAIELRTT